MLEVTSEVEIDQPIDVVFPYLADATNNPEWQDGMVACRWRTDGPIAVGSVYEQHARMMGRDIESVFEVTEHVDVGDVRRIAIRTLESTFPIEVTRTVVALPGGRSRASALVRGDASGVFRLAEPLLRRMVQRSVRGDYARLRQVLEA